MSLVQFNKSEIVMPDLIRQRILIILFDVILNQVQDGRGTKLLVIIEKINQRSLISLRHDLYPSVFQ